MKFLSNVKDKMWDVVLVILGVLIELILIHLPEYTTPHYYMTMLPVLTLFTGFTFWIFFSQISTWKIPNTATKILVAGIAGGFLWGSFAEYKHQFFVQQSDTDKTVINYIKSVTTSDNYVLLWGAEASINYATQRRSPTRFVYQYPLYQKDYVSEL